MPANLKVLASDAFLQPGQLPETSSVFSASIRGIVLPPVLDVYPELNAAVGGDLRRLFSVGVLDLDTATELIDADSIPVLDPESVSESPSP